MTRFVLEKCVPGTLVLLTVVAVLAMPGAVHAQQVFDIDLRKTGPAVPIEQDEPGYPGGSVRRGQEGWVRMSYVVTADGRAIDPIILNSSGGSGFEEEARSIMPKWRFEPTGTELPYNVVNIRSEINRGRDAATSNFIRRTKQILTYLHNDDIEAARKHADLTSRMGGWNLYESTMLWLLVGRVEGAEDNNAGKLEMYTRALEMGNSKAIPEDDRVELLEKIFLLQSHFQQYTSALETREDLESLPGSEEALQRTAERAAEIRTKLESEPVTVAHATISNPCDCEEGEPLWHYVPARRTFSFANTSGNVVRFEARCENRRLSAAVEPDKTWTLDPEWGYCRVIVFGDDGATFDFLGHLQDIEGESAATESSVARNDVLDYRSRSQ